MTFSLGCGPENGDNDYSDDGLEVGDVCGFNDGYPFEQFESFDIIMDLPMDM